MFPRLFYTALIMIGFTENSYTSAQKFYTSEFYTSEEIEAARTLGQSQLTLKDYAHTQDDKKTWFSLTKEKYAYKTFQHEKYSLVRMDSRPSSSTLGDWFGEIALFPIPATSLEKIYRSVQGFNDALGTPYDSVIRFQYIPKDLTSQIRPHVILVKSETFSQNQGKGYN